MTNFCSKDLTENARLQYLQAMGITPWVLREPFAIEQEESVNSDRLTIKNLNDSEGIKEGETGDRSLTNKQEKWVSEQPALKTKTQSEPESETEITNHQSKVSNQPTVSVDDSNKVIETNHYLKLVSWNSAVLANSSVEEQDIYNAPKSVNKTLLIVCRHKVDQPANSFANQQSPSRFMQDYLKTIIELGAQENLNIDIQLAHLATAGLGQSVIRTSSYLESKSPDLILALGDETATYLLREENDVSKLRCRLNKFNLTSDVIVSYHPFDLIKNARLKALAYEDILFCINTLCEK